MKIELYVPGLLAVPGRHLDALRLPDLPVLNHWCARARAVAVADGRYGFISQQLSVSRPPLAALAWLGAFGHAPERQTFHATPVHLQAGLRDVVLFAGGGLEVAEPELKAIVADANRHFDHEPTLVVAGGQLFLQASAQLDVHTVPLHCVQGATLRQHLPSGRNAGQLNSWVNELQMFLHSHEINQRRAAQGRPQLNGIWVWGEGGLPSTTRSTNVMVHAESPHMRGLGALLGASVARPAAAHHLQIEGEHNRHIVEFDACARALDADDTLAWQASVADVARHWLQPVLDQVHSGECSEAVLYGGDGVARHLNGKKRWWHGLAPWRGATRPQLSRES